MLDDFFNHLSETAANNIFGDGRQQKVVTKETGKKKRDHATQLDVELKKLEYQEKLLEMEKRKQDDKMNRMMMKYIVYLLLIGFFAALVSNFLK